MKINILINGLAGQGPNVLARIVGNIFSKWGYYVFINRDYGSFVRGGKNSNQITISEKPIMSNDSKIDFTFSLIDLDKGNMYFAGRIAKIFGIDFNIIEDELKKIKNFEENMADAREGYNDAKEEMKLKKLNNKIKLFNGAEATADGAIKSGLDVYYAYPMTPATSLMNELASKQNEKNIMVLEMENEIAVVNAALGSAITGAKSMVGTSGGGFDLMTEALSMAGISEIPIVVYLAQRPGPGTGVATSTSQGDLNVARNYGHGEFPRLLVAPGDVIESEELTSQAFYFSQKYKIPAMIITDKHLAESIYSVDSEAKITKSEKSMVFGRFNSYESDENGIATENLEIIKKNVEKRLHKLKNIQKETEKFEMFKSYGNKDSKNKLLFWGSTKGSVVDAIAGLDVEAIQILYLEPFSEKLRILLTGKNVIVVENNSTSPLSSLLAEKTGLIVEEKNKILRYDGLPFMCDELRKEIERRIK